MQKILFPLGAGIHRLREPGYPGVGCSRRRAKPRIELLDNHQFKWGDRIDFGDIGDDIAAICLSRPTNPTANVVTDEEMERLAATMATERGIYSVGDRG